MEDEEEISPKEQVIPDHAENSDTEEDTTDPIPDIKSKDTESNKSFRNSDLQHLSFLEVLSARNFSVDDLKHFRTKLLRPFFQEQELLRKKQIQERDKYETLLNERRLDLREAEFRLKKLQGNVQNKEAELKEVNLLIAQKAQKYEEVLSNLNLRKSRPVKRFIAESREELKEILNDHVNFQKDLSDLKIKELEAAVDKRISTLREILKRLESAFEKVKERAEKLKDEDRNTASAYTLISIGLAATTASGWLFSLFLNNSGYKLQNPLNSLLQDAYGFILQFIQLSESRLIGGAFAFVCILIVLVSITILFKIYDARLQKIGSEHTFGAMGISSKQEKAFFNLNIKGSNFFSLWLQLLPFIVLLSIVFIVLSVGHSSQTSNIGDLLTGQSLGSTLSLLCAGFTLLYVTKIIEPRASKNESDKSWRNFIELILTLGLFITIILLIVFWAFAVDKPSHDNLLSILLFIATTLLSSLCIAYGIRDQIVFFRYDQLDQRIRSTLYLIDFYSAGLTLKTMLDSNSTFNTKIEEIQFRLMDLIKEKASWNSKIPRSFIPKKTFWLPWLFKKDHTKEKIKGPEVNDYQRKYYPELVDEVERAFQDLSHLQEQQNELKREIESYQNLSHADLKAQEEKISNLKTKIENLIRYKFLRVSDLDLEIQGIEKSIQQASIEMEEGFNLGLWWLNNKESYD